MRKTINLSIFLIFTLITVMFVSAFSFSDKNKNVICLDGCYSDLSEEQIADYFRYGEELAIILASVSENDYDKIIQSYCSSNTNSLFEIMNREIDSTMEEYSLIKILPSKEAERIFRLSYPIDGDSRLIITPTSISIDHLFISDSDTSFSNGIKSTNYKSGTCAKTYYGTDGRTLFSLSVSCTFYYDGSSAWYKSGYSKSYSKGSLSVWQVSNWAGTHYSSGTSHIAYCSGDFHWGYTYNNGLIIQDYHCENSLTCYSDGTIIGLATKSP